MEPLYNKKKGFIINITYFILIILIIYIGFNYVLTLVSPFLFAFIIAYILKKPTKFISAKIKIPYKIISIVIVFVFYATIGVLITLIGIKVVTSISTFLVKITSMYDGQIKPAFLDGFNIIEDAVRRIDPEFVSVLNDWVNTSVNSLGNNLSKISMSIVGAISNYATSLPLFLIKSLLMIISTFFIAYDYDVLSKFVLKQFSDKGGVILISIKQYMFNILFVAIRSYAIIIFITFIELSIGLSIIGVSNAIYLALLIALFDVLPVLGTGGVLIPWTLISLIRGDYKLAVGLIIVYIIVTVVRNIIEPKIVGNQLGLHPIVTLISMFVGVNLFGIFGMLGFPIMLSLLRHLNDTGIIRIFKK